MRVEEHTITLAGAPVFYRSAAPEEPSSGGPGATGAAGPTAPAAGRTAPVPVYLHGAPTSSDDWLGFLKRAGGVAPDLLGFGRSAKGGHLEYSPEALADFVDELLSEVGVDRIQLVLHGWGTPVGALLAARYPQRVDRVVVFNSVPLLPGLAWPWWARQWRIRAVGELAMGSTTKSVLARWLRRGAVQSGAWPSSRINQVWEQFDQGTQRAVIRLQRAVDEERMEALAAALESIRAPVLVLWGEQDPWWGSEVLDAYAARLSGARVERLPGAGHWPWLDDPGAIDLVTEFLGGADDH